MKNLNPMKSLNRLTAVLFVLVGFCAGVAFNFIPITTAAQGPPETPPAALKSVAHDATLAGNGTTAAPLGIASAGVRTGQLANGAVTAPKLSAAAPPTAGQVLGFNCAYLAWQNAPVGGVRVVDSRGQDVGPFEQSIGGSFALRRITGFTFALSITKSGFVSGFVNFFHMTSDCSGDRFVIEDGARLVRIAPQINGKLIYAADPLQQITANSLETVTPPADLNMPGHCSRLNPTPELAGLVTTFDLSTLGLVPPFHLEF